MKLLRRPRKKRQIKLMLRISHLREKMRPLRR